MTEFKADLADMELDTLYEGIEGVQDAIQIYGEVESALGALAEAVSQDYTEGEWYMDGITLADVNRTVDLDQFELSSAEGEVNKMIEQLRDIEMDFESEIEARESGEEL